jgi:hypothetical protein
MNGLRLEDKLGANPFKYGMIGSTDSHVSLSTTREDNWFGKLPNGEPSAERSSAVFVRDSETGDALVSDWELSAAGLAAVWAKDNTREAIFDALARKEVYATTGSRLTVRIFGGWDFEPDEVERHDFARDPDNANLDRVQVIKGWLDGNETHERIYDVACSDDRAIVNRRCEREVGSTVDVADASYTNTIGDPLLTAHWVDPDFDPDQRAFYYVRVIEIPKPRWTA